MGKLEEAQDILRTFGLPSAQCNDISAFTLLALCNISESDNWDKASNPSLGVSKGIMSFIESSYGRNYAANTRETVRKDVLHQFEQARIVNYNPDEPRLPINSPKTHYALTSDALEVIKAYGSEEYIKKLNIFKNSYSELKLAYSKERKIHQIPLMLPDGLQIELSSGRHNEVQAAVLERFAPRFAKGAILLYLGDTAKKDLFIKKELLMDLGIPIGQHSKLPDVVLYDPERNWLYLIEAVTSRGPMSPTRVKQLEELTKDCNLGVIYVTAFPDMAEFKKHSKFIAWETEVWIAEMPDHMIHFNGDKFLGPR